MTQHHFYQTCAYFTAARYMRSIERVADATFAPTGLKPAYSYIMMALEDTPTMTIMAISEQLGYERSTVSRLVKALAQRDLVQLATAGRATTVSLGPASTDFLKLANQCLTAFGEQTDAYLGADKAPMTALLTENNQKLRQQLS